MTNKVAVFSFTKRRSASEASAQNGIPTTEQVSDGDLLLLAAKGDETAFASLYSRYAKKLFTYFLKRCNQDADLADDLRQQVFLQLLESKVYAAAQQGMARDSLSSLLFTIAANLLKNTYRSHERRERRENVYRATQAIDNIPEEALVDQTALSRAMSCLPEDQQLCLRLRFMRGMSILEIAEFIGKPEGTVKSRLHYGLGKLRKLLDQPTKQKS